MEAFDEAGALRDTADGVVAFDPSSGEVLAVTEAFRSLLEYDPGDLPGRDVRALGPGDRSNGETADLAGDLLQQARRNGSAQFTWRPSTASGQRRAFEASLSVASRDGREVGVVVVRDVDGQWHEDRSANDGWWRHRAARESSQLGVRVMDYSAVRERARSLVDDPADLAAYLDEHPGEFDALIDRRRLVDADETYLEFVGADSLSHLVDTVDWTGTERTASATKELFQAVATGDTALTQECPVRNIEDGSLRWLERELLVPPGREEDRFERVLVTAVDVTERTSLERRLSETTEALAESRERYRALFENSPISLWELDFSDAMAYAKEVAAGADGDVVEYLEANPTEYREILERYEVIDVNENAVEYYDADSKDHLIRDIETVATEQGIAVHRRMLDRLLDGERSVHEELSYRTFDGEERHELFILTVPEAYAADFSRVYLATVDIEQQKTYERRIEAQNRTLERLAGIVSHDLTTPVSAAQNILELLRQDLAEADADVDRPLAELEGVLEDLEEFAEHLPRLARESSHVEDRRHCELAEVAETAWRAVDTGELRLEIEGSLTIACDPSRLRQAFRNLFGNVVDHATGVDVSPEATTVTVGPLSEGFYVADDGPGIPSERGAAIFDYGTTTGDGSGMGLAIVRTIVEAHGWEIDVTESEAGGARFEVRLGEA